MTVRYKRAADLFQLAGPQVNFTHKALLTSTLAMFSLVFLTIYSNVKGRLWTSQTNQRYTFFFWETGSELAQNWVAVNSLSSESIFHGWIPLW